MPNATSQTNGNGPDEANTDACPTCQGRCFFQSNAPFGHDDFGRAHRCVACNGHGSRSGYLDATRRYAGIPQRLWDTCTFALFDSSRGGRQAKSAAEEWCEPTGDAPPFLVLTGPSGVGKTHLAVAAARQLVEGGIHLLRFYSLPRLLDELRATQRDDASLSLDAARQAIAGEPVLILDDLGVERQTDFSTEQLTAIVDWRWMNGMRTLVTTNATPAEIPPRVFSRLADRSLSRMVVCTGPDQRLAVQS